MKKKLLAVLLAGVLTVGTAGVPQAAFAANVDETPATSIEDLKVGDTFYAPFDPDTGALDGDNLFTDFMGAVDNSNNAWYVCELLSDNTIGISTGCIANEYAHEGCKIQIPDKIGKYTVTEIDDTSLGGFSSITVPDTVTTINQSAFAYDLFLEEVNFDANSQLKLIDQWAFQDCRSLKSITIPASVETIAYGAFMNSDQELVVGGGYDRDFTNTYSLTSVKFAEGSKLQTLGDYAFDRQYALTDIELPEGLTTIGEGAFNSCTALKSLKLPNNITAIGDGAFMDCLDLKSVTIPASVETIGEYPFALTRYTAFDETSSMTEINVSPDSKNFKSVDGVLYTADGKKLVACPAGKTEIKFADGVTEIQQVAFQGCNQITSVTIPNTITKLPKDAFALCTKLNKATLPETLTEIGQWAFQYTALTDITIPESVTAIDKQAFENSLLKNINGVSGSYAETFAKENGYTFNGKSSSGSSGSSSSSGSTTTTDTESTFKDDSEDKAADIEVVAKPNVIPKEAHFSVRFDDKNSTDTRVAYNCFFTYNGAEYEPTDTVTVRIPVPVAMRDIADTLKVYHLQDGKYVNMKAKVEDGYLVFETDHFSTYVVTAEELEETAENTETPTTTETTPAGTTNPPTGVAVGLVPVILAGAVVIVSAKKRK